MQNKVCAKCGAAVAADAKFCTTCGSSEFAAAPVAPVQPAVAPVAAPVKKKFPTWAKVLIIIGIIILIPVACTVACVGGFVGAVEEGVNEYEQALEEIENTYGDENDDTTSVLDTEYNSGEVFENGSLSLSFDSVNTNYTNYSQYIAPESGYKVIEYKFTAKNIGSSDLWISSYSFDCYADDVAMDHFYGANDASNKTGGSISSGKTAYINVYCEVPTSAVNPTVEYDFSWLDDNIVFNAK